MSVVNFSVTQRALQDSIVTHCTLKFCPEDEKIRKEIINQVTL